MTAISPSIICYIPSFNNSAEVALSLAHRSGLPCVVSDNASSPEHIEHIRQIVSRSSGVTLIEQPRNLGRVGNWEYCIRHFRQSGAAWLKWLFAGDTLLDTAADDFQDAIRRFPDARLIVGEHLEVWSDRTVPWRRLNETQIINPARALELAVELVNWFGAASGQCFRHDAFDDLTISALPWTADGLMCLDVASRFPVVYLAKPVVEWRVASRRFFTTQADGTRARLEEALFRVEAAERLKRLTGDDNAFAATMRRIEADFRRRELNKMSAGRILRHLAGRLRYSWSRGR